MNTHELAAYLDENSTILANFKTKVIAYLEDKNEQRQPAKRYNDAQIRRQSEKYVAQFIDNIQAQIERAIPSQHHTPEAWMTYFDNHNLLEELELAVAETEFGAEE
ncbi:hypothetical protein SAMN05216431_101124 [Ligilactobacillus sp. WC1T17]|uniref:Uncharacterized protein n=1 Tax=Ligilactobacillus ruminis TaxID=1623 RepID=A0ABY1A930_9LACO|nr:hypothetical protein SAMN05216431_101124 [Ligilactobacillus ruminis]